MILLVPVPVERTDGLRWSVVDLCGVFSFYLFFFWGGGEGLGCVALRLT